MGHFPLRIYFLMLPGIRNWSVPLPPRKHWDDRFSQQPLLRLLPFLSWLSSVPPSFQIFLFTDTLRQTQSSVLKAADSLSLADLLLDITGKTFDSALDSQHSVRNDLAGELLGRTLDYAKHPFCLIPRADFHDEPPCSRQYFPQASCYTCLCRLLSALLLPSLHFIILQGMLNSNLRGRTGQDNYCRYFGSR